MKLDRADIMKEIKGLQATKRIFMQQDFLDFIGRKCIQVLQDQTNLKASETWDKKMNQEYRDGHRYKTEIRSHTSRIILENVATNQFGEYFSAYIEYGTGIFSPNSTKPQGWIYPTDRADRNPTKKYNKETGTWYAFTWGQTPKEVYTSAIKVIEDNLDNWIKEYMKGG